MSNTRRTTQRATIKRNTRKQYSEAMREALPRRMRRHALHKAVLTPKTSKDDA